MTFGRIGLALVAVTAAFAWPGSASAALGGPVVIGGDDFTQHGSVNTSTGELQDGWLYLQRALENVAPKVVRPGATATVAALGSAPSDATTEDGGAAIGRAAAKAGLAVAYYDGEAAINAFFGALAAGSTNPGIIWIGGDGARNDLVAAEADALTANATRIADFVNSGGGLVSHGSQYGWLFALLPRLSAKSGGAEGDLYLTQAGEAAFPGVTVSHVNGGPWHNYFEGDFADLEILARSSTRKDSRTGQDAAVIIGGASVTLPGAISLSPQSSTGLPGTTHAVTATIKQANGAAIVGARVAFSVTAGVNAGITGSAVTDSSGEARFSYRSNGVRGTDTIQASFVDATGTTRTDTATRVWAVPGPGGGPPPGPGGWPPGDCILTTATKQLLAGIPSPVVARTRGEDGLPRAGVAVTLRGAGNARTVRTDARGVARFVAAPKQAGRITLGGAGCGAEVRVAVVKARSCAGVTLGLRKAKGLRPIVLVARVRIAGKPAAGVRVRARGAGHSTSALTNARGVVTLRGRARTGIVTVTVPGVLACTKRIAVTRAFLRRR